jgi:hypothetical protein
MSTPTAENTETKKPRLSLGAVAKRILNGEFLTTEEMMGQLPFLGFLCLLFLLNIAWIYRFETVERKLQTVNTELEQKKAEHNTAISKLEEKKRHSRLVEELKSLGLISPNNPPHVIEADGSWIDSE